MPPFAAPQSAARRRAYSRTMESDIPPAEFDNFGHRAEDKLLPPRVSKLELDVSELKARLDQLATREDLANTEARLIKWMVGLFVGFMTLNIVVMAFVLNYAAPPQGRFAKGAEAPVAAAPPQLMAAPPIVIVIPPGAVQWQAQPSK